MSNLMGYVLLVFLSGACIFMLGFFPVAYQQFAAKHQTDTEEDTVQFPPLGDTTLEPVPRHYQQTILLIIDALRLDFVDPERMPYAVEAACDRVNLKVAIPTVTMPRLKSLMTGTVSNFIDIVLNLGSSQLLSDSLMHRLQRNGDVMVFAGDRTWTQLFPSQFTRSYPNVDSFYVDDFYEGDKNITKVLEKELQRKDWSLMVLHYLGLDHIGHVEGSESSKIPAKLLEMDAVIKQILETIKDRKAMLLVTGDHGMRNGGSHGGSTHEEMHVPLLYYHNGCQRDPEKTEIETYNQIDLAPTLSILMGLPIPQPSIGRLIDELLVDLPLLHQLNAHFFNTHHLRHQITKTFGNEQSYAFDVPAPATYWHERFHDEAHADKDDELEKFAAIRGHYTQVEINMSKELSASRAQFNYGYIGLGLSMLCLSTLFGFLQFANSHQEPKFCHKALLLFYLLVFALVGGLLYSQSRHMEFFVWSLPTSVSIHLFLKIVTALPRFRWRHNMPKIRPLLVCFAIQTLVLISSSYIEYEEESWYYMCATILLAVTGSVLLKKSKFFGLAERGEILENLGKQCLSLKSMLFCIIILAVLKRLPAISVATLLKHPTVLSLWCALGLLALLIQLRQFLNRWQLIAASCSAVAIYCYRSLNGILIFPFIEHVRASLILIAFASGILFLLLQPLLGDRKTQRNGQLKTAFSAILLVGALLHKAPNIPFVAILMATLEVIYKMCDDYLYDRPTVLFYKTALTIFLGNTFFFLQGNSNSLATIDLNPGYIGQTTYKPMVVAILVTLNTYSGPINAFFQLLTHLKTAKMRRDSDPIRVFTCCDTNDRQLQRENIQFAMDIWTLATLTPVAYYFCLLVTFRYHLFIYSVFAPKALYAFYSVFVYFLKFSVASVFLHLV